MQRLILNSVCGKRVSRDAELLDSVERAPPGGGKGESSPALLSFLSKCNVTKEQSVVVSHIVSISHVCVTFSDGQLSGF